MKVAAAMALMTSAIRDIIRALHMFETGLKIRGLKGIVCCLIVWVVILARLVVRHQGFLVECCVATLLIVHGRGMEVQPASLLGSKLVAQLLIDEVIFIALFAGAIIHFLIVVVAIHGLPSILLRLTVVVEHLLPSEVVCVLRNLVWMCTLPVALEHCKLISVALSLACLLVCLYLAILVDCNLLSI